MQEETNLRQRPMSRREMMVLFGGVGTALGITQTMGCGGGGDATPTLSPTGTPTPGATPTPTPGATPTPTPSASPTPTPTPSPTPRPACTLIPSETDGPYPLYSVLSNATMIRQNIAEGKTGVPLTVALNLLNVNDSCGPVTNAYVYLWHCDKDGAYSGYSAGANGNHVGETFCRGIQHADANGQVTFQTIYPGWYTGRITHIHFQVYLATLTGTATATSQIAFPQDVTTAVYNSSLYAARGQNTSVRSFAEDNIFSDGVADELATLAGDIAAGFTATLAVGIRA